MDSLLPCLQLACSSDLLINAQIHCVPSTLTSTPHSFMVLPKNSPHLNEKVHAQLISYVQLFATLWTVACQAPLSVELSRQDYCSGLPFSPPGGLPDPRTELCLPCLLHYRQILYH